MVLLDKTNLELGKRPHRTAASEFFGMGPSVHNCWSDLVLLGSGGELVGAYHCGCRGRDCVDWRS